MELRLVAQAGRAKGQAVDVRAEKFFIGGDAHCQLRPGIDGLASLHALIEQRQGRWLIRDFGTADGTIVNDRPLLAKEVDLADGDTIRIGPVELLVMIRPRADGDPPCFGEVPPGWPLTAEAQSARVAPPPAHAAPASSPADRPLEPQSLSYRVEGDALVVTLLPTELSSERIIGRVRFELRALLEQPLPRQVVLDLSHVTYLSSSAVGVILAHNQGLGRAGGSLRVCCVNPRVMPVLEQMRMNMIIDIYESLAEALAEPWE